MVISCISKNGPTSFSVGTSVVFPIALSVLIRDWNLNLIEEIGHKAQGVQHLNLLDNIASFALGRFQRRPDLDSFLGIHHDLIEQLQNIVIILFGFAAPDPLPPLCPANKMPPKSDKHSKNRVLCSIQSTWPSSQTVGDKLLHQIPVTKTGCHNPSCMRAHKLSG